MVKELSRVQVKQALIKEYCAVKNIECTPKIVRDCMSSWWIHYGNPSSTYGLALTNRGFVILRDIVKLKFYEIKIDTPVYSLKQMMDLQRSLDSPFHISQDRINLMDEKMVVVLTLFSGNLDKFLQFLSKSS